LTYDNFKLLRGKTKKIFKLKYKGGYVLVNDLEYINNQYVLGTNDQGVFISDTGFKKFKHISETEGLQSKLVKQIKTDKQGNIWVLNDKGVDRINKDLTVTRVFSIAEIDDYDIENFSVSKDSLWLFTDNTVYSLSYAKRFKETKIPLVLNTLTVDNETKYYEADTNISIGPLWETIKINYAGIYLHEQDHIVYKYRIVREGDTGSWQKTKSNLLTLAALKSGNYLVQIQAFHNIYPNIHSEMLNTRFVIKPYFYQTWWFYLLIGLFILAAVVGFLYYRNQIKLRELKLESELNKYKLQGLQNQMNPHFIFNSMSTIQNLILNDDNKHALDFISDFSTLMRTMLQNSRNDEISLINELDFLQKYIHLEKVRYKDNFDFKIELKIDEFDLEDIYIPTMMVQPLLENAVKHGVSNLLNRSGLIIIDLSFENENENILCIQIIDNGIGMVNKQIKNHTSTALQVIQERLAIYSKNGIFGSLNINYTENGTTCILKIPV
jgi:anti-sigma regulatory factor (Ser/Thr protein kinase)